MYLSLRGVTIPNEGYVLASDVGLFTGSVDGALHCNTDRSGCCHAFDGAAQGHWYYPDGTQVRSFTQEDAANTGLRNFFFRSRTTGVVRLNRFGDPPQRGRFRCELPNASGDNVTLYVNIGECFVIRELLHHCRISHSFLVDVIPTAPPLTVHPIATTNDVPPATTGAPTTITITVSPITFSGSAIAGESYRLRCTVTVTGSTDQPVFTWLMGPMNSEVTAGVETADSMSMLTFNPLAATHAGTYTCRATLNSAMDSETVTVSVESEWFNKHTCP